MDEAHRRILDRDRPTQDVREHFEPQLSLVRTLVDYGTNLIPRALTSSERELADLVVCTALLKHCVTMLDGIELQVSNAAVLAAHVSLRALYEADLCLHWMLAEDTSRRATLYYVAHLRKQRTWAARGVPGTQEHEWFEDVFNRADDALGRSRGESAQRGLDPSSKQLEAIDRVLGSAEFKTINQEFEAFWNRKYDPEWYALGGPRSLRAVAEALDRLPEHKVIYSTLSAVAHASDLGSHTVVSGNTATLEPIRHLDGLPLLLRITLNIALGCYRRVLEVYRPAEIENFNRRYESEWREAFLQIPQINYKDDDVADL